ncbi:MAG: SCO family protein [Verrucomicrobiota bacterium]
MNETESPTPQQAGAAAFPITLWSIIIVIVLGFLVAWNYLIRFQNEQANPRLAYRERIEKSIELTEAVSGETVQVSDLQGKVLVVSNIYPYCPTGCGTVVAQLLELYSEFGENPNVHFVSFQVDPIRYTPDEFKDWVEMQEAAKPNWWFLTGSAEELYDYLFKYFRYSRPVRNEEDENDIAHDLSIRLVDHAGNLRGDGYSIHIDGLKDDPYARLRRDLNSLVVEAVDAKRG